MARITRWMKDLKPERPNANEEARAILCAIKSSMDKYGLWLALVREAMAKKDNGED